MKDKKCLLSLIVGLFLIIGCIGCGKKENEIDKPNENLVGGYNINNSVAGTLPEDALNAFNKATNNDKKYTPLSCMGTQVVAGINYMILAKYEEKLVVLIIYEDLENNASIIDTYDFKLTDYLNNNEEKINEEIIDGGWIVSSEGNLYTMPQNLASAWSESFTNYNEIKLEALACLGTQVVSGTNYAMLARNIAEGDEKQNLYVVVIYDDLNHNASITSVNQINLSKIIK